MDTNDINKKLEELLSRNQDIFDDFVNAVSKVDLGIHSKTFKEKTDYEENLKNNPTSYLPDEVLKSLGFMPFYVYSELVTDFINKIANNEKRVDLIFKDGALDQTNWREKIMKVKDGEVWLSLIDNLLQCVAFTHEARVKDMRDKKAGVKIM